MKLSIIIPAYNEEASISQIIERCLQAKESLRLHTSLTDVELIVVNDGSQDNTHAIAKQFEESGKIQLTSYGTNSGYGAALKRGFLRASGEYIGFLDADGTCDPKYFVELFNTLERSRAQIAVGSRLGPQSHMPTMRKVGNRLYAFLISAISNKKITDSASGMRIIERSSLHKMYPLPDGMNFTLAMSAKAAMDRQLKIVETPMPYQERIGTSKLDVLRDGCRFLKTIFEVSFFYKPLKLCLFAACVLWGICVGYGIPLVLFYLKHQRVLETDIYKMITIIVCGVLSIKIFFVGMISDQVLSMFSDLPMRSEQVRHRFVQRLLVPRNAFVLGVCLVLAGVLLNSHTITEYMALRTIHRHWTYVLTGGFLVLIGAECLVGAFLQKLLIMCRDVLQLRRTPR